MSVTTTGNRIPYVGNGLTTVFPFPFLFLDQSHLAVVRISSTGVDTPQVLGSDYTVSGAGAAGGGSVTMVVAPPVGTTLVIYRNTSKNQQVDYVAQDNFPAETHETALDKGVLQDQDTNRRVDRSLRIPDSNSETKVPEMTVAQRTDRVVAFDSDSQLDLSLSRSALNRIIVANPVGGLTEVTDYGSTGDATTAIVDYGSTA